MYIHADNPDEVNIEYVEYFKQENKTYVHVNGKVFSVHGEFDENDVEIE